MEEEREKPWNFHTCKSCPYRSKSIVAMCHHVRFHQRTNETETFARDTNTPEMLECELCPFESNLRIDLTEHTRVVHQEKEANEQLENILKCYHCRNCHFETHSVLVLTKHVDDCKLGCVKSSNEDHETPGEKESSATLTIAREDSKMSEHNYHLLRLRCGDFQISNQPKGKMEKLGSIVQSSNDVSTLEKHKKQLEDCIYWHVHIDEQKQPTSLQNLSAGLNTVTSANTIVINKESSWVVMRTKNILHKGTYHCNFIAQDTTLKAFIIASTPESGHVCNSTRTYPDKDWTYALLSRKPNEIGAKVSVEFCAPMGQFEGDEVSLTPDELITPLRLRRTLIFAGHKRRNCYYCKEFKAPRTEMITHLLTTHAEEAEIAKIMQMGEDAKERRLALRELVKEGDRQARFRQKLGRILTTTQKRSVATHQGRYRKKHCCYYCQKMYADISRHLCVMHAEQPKVVELMRLEAGSKERNQALKKLRLKGDDVYNRRVAPNERITARKLTKNSIQSCLTCHNCFQVLVPRNFARHERRCTGRPPNRKRVTAEAAAADYERFVANGWVSSSSEDCQEEAKL